MPSVTSSPCDGLQKLQSIGSRYESQTNRPRTIHRVNAKSAGTRLIDAAIADHLQRCATCRSAQANKSMSGISACVVARSLHQSEIRLRQNVDTARSMFAKAGYAEAARQLLRERRQHIATCGLCLAEESGSAA